MVAHSDNPLFTLKPDKLEELVKDEYSLVKVIKKDLTIPLPPYNLDKVASAIHKMIKHDWTYKHSLDLQGILLYHDQLEFKSDYGKIKDDNPLIFWDISARFFAFCPQEKFIIRGTINRFTKSQVMNALVLNCIIAALTPEKVHQSIQDQMELGKEILFRIESFESEHSLIYGLIDEECINLMKQHGMLKTTDDLIEDDNANANENDDHYKMETEEIDDFFTK